MSVLMEDRVLRPRTFRTLFVCSWWQHILYHPSDYITLCVLYGGLRK